MRHCVVIVGCAADAARAAPSIETGDGRRPRTTSWFLRREQAGDGRLFDDVPASPLRWLSIPGHAYRCYLHVSSVKTWSGRRPYVFIRGKSSGARLAALAASWAGGDVVQSAAEPGGCLSRTRFLLEADGSLRLNA